MRTPKKSSSEVKDFLSTVALGNSEPDSLAKGAAELLGRLGFTMNEIAKGQYSRASTARVNDLKHGLKRIAETQAEFWDALSDFERLSGIELTSAHNDFTQFAEPSDEDVAWVTIAS